MRGALAIVALILIGLLAGMAAAIVLVAGITALVKPGAPRERAWRKQSIEEKEAS